MGLMNIVMLFSPVAMLLVGLAGVHSYECTGMGRKYCSSETPAHQAKDDCPVPCQRRRCQGRRSTELLSSGARRSSREGGTPKWEEIASSGLYDHVFVDGDEICLATCWFEPWNSRCYKWETYMGAKYCRGLNCKHDEEARYSGCHSDPDSGRKKLPWHRPTCKECTRVFPEACLNELRDFYPDYMIETLEASKRNRESDARKYCYLTYFGPFLGMDITTSKRAVRNKGDSSSRKLLQSSEEELSILDDQTIRTFRDLERTGGLSCPAPQCLTVHDTLLRSLVAPWYHTADANGRCSFDDCKSDRSMGQQWCKNSAGNCIACRGTWCPPKSVPFWAPVTTATYEPLLPFYQDNNIQDRFPRSACSYRPLTQISEEEASGLPWFDTAGDIFSIEPRKQNSQLENVLKVTRDEYNAELFAEFERENARVQAEEKRIAEEKKRIEMNLEAQRKALEVKRLQEEAEKASKAAAAIVARQRMAEQAKRQREQEKANAQELEANARQYCYDKYISEAARYGGISIGGGLAAVNGGSDSEEGENFDLEEMEEDGLLRCPPAECYFEEVVQEIAEDSRSAILEKIQDGYEDEKLDDSDEAREVDWRTRSLLPWYYQTSDGFCSWPRMGCNASTPVISSCGTGTKSCVSCGGIWCPPITGRGWAPVSRTSHLDLPDALKLVDGNALVVIGSKDEMIQGDSISPGAGDNGAAVFALFDYRKCTNSSVTSLPLWQVKDLFWPGMIDFAATIARQRGIQGNGNKIKAVGPSS